jgi:hypothetical protein
MDGPKKLEQLTLSGSAPTQTGVILEHASVSGDMTN